MFSNILRNRSILSIFLSFLIFLLVLFFGNTEPFILLNKKIQNNYYALKNLVFGNSISDDIIIVEIDNNTFNVDAKEGLGLGRFPFDRKSYVPIIENLKKAGAKVIGFDIIFAEKTSSDDKLSQAMKTAGNVLVGGFFEEEQVSQKEEVVFKKSVFDNDIVGTGYFSPKIDEYNHVVYSIEPFVRLKGGDIYEHFSFVVLKAYYSFIYGKDYIGIVPRADDFFYYITPTRRVPLAIEKGKEVLINYFKYDDYKKNNQIVSFVDVYDSSRFEELTKFVSFKDKIVLIGAAAKGIKDIFYTPNGIEYGVYTHVNMINTVLTHSYLNYFDSNLEYILILLLITISVYFNLSRSGYVLIFSNIAIVTLFLIVFPALVMIFTISILNYSMELVFALILSLMISNIVKYLMENKDRMKLSKALSEYVSVDIARSIVSGNGKIDLDGENKEIAIFFSDIEGFTSISEKFTPEILVGFLREYLSEMSNIILDEKGFINKYEGDAIMALWGVFDEDHKAACNACLSAIYQQRRLKVLNDDWSKRGFATVRARIGIHLGSAIIGNIGAQGRKMEFTALGDNVNLASRMEGVNKFYGTYMCVSEDVYIAAKEQFEFRYLDTIRVKGKQIGVKIYQLVEEKGNIDADVKEIFRQFQEAIGLYSKQNFQEALEIFQKLSELGDKPSTTYVERCEMYIKNPPGKDWDQIWTMQSK